MSTALKANVEQAGLSTRTQIASTQAKVEAQQAALRTAELNLEYGTIRAPISGRIGDTLMPVGGLVTPTSAQPLTTIVPLDPIWVRFKVTESEYLVVDRAQGGLPGAALPLTLILADDSEFPSIGHIENSLNQVDPKTGTLELQARFPNPAAHRAAGTVRPRPGAGGASARTPFWFRRRPSSSCRACRRSTPWTRTTRSQCSR